MLLQFLLRQLIPSAFGVGWGWVGGLVIMLAVPLTAALRITPASLRHPLGNIRGRLLAR